MDEADLLRTNDDGQRRVIAQVAAVGGHECKREPRLFSRSSGLRALQCERELRVRPGRGNVEERCVGALEAILQGACTQI